MNRAARHPAGRALLVSVLTVVVATLWADSALAQEGDYAVESSRWNGMSEFLGVGSALGIELEPTDTLDFSKLTADQTLVIVYPATELDVTELAAFIVEGGRVLLADDFGKSGGLLERLDIERSPAMSGGLPHDEFVRDNKALPVFEPTGVHPLLEGVSTVVANHPSVLRHPGGPVIAYKKRGGLVYDMNLGEGKVIVLGDSSLLINQMLEVADNQKLAQNALQYLCEGISPCSPKLLVGEIEQSGTFQSSDAPETTLAWLAEAFNESVARLQAEIPSSPLLFYLAIILSGGLALYLGTIFSVRDSRRYSEYIDEAIEDVPAPQSEFEWNVSRFGANRRETNFALPLSILKEIFEELFLKELGHWEQRPGERPSVIHLARRFRNDYLQQKPPRERDRIEREVRDVLATYAKIPTRHRVFLDSDAYFSDRDLIKLYRRTMRILELMDLEEEYERRTRTLV